MCFSSLSNADIPEFGLQSLPSVNPWINTFPLNFSFKKVHSDNK